jgi:hypothetical protein
MADEQTFLSVLTAWRAAEERRIVADERYREEHAREFSALEKGTDTARKAHADAKTSTLRLDRNFAQMEATALHHKVVFYRGSAGEAERV